VFWFLRTMVRRRVVVNLASGRAFRGILWAKRGPLLVLRDATMYEPGVPPVAVDGETVIERRTVEFIQVLPAAAAATPADEAA
jgi:small nuclear ribonucleoprotein (snRNP)-like protein